jgi:YVTN family beta-propeller protein
MIPRWLLLAPTLLPALLTEQGTPPPEVARPVFKSPLGLAVDRDGARAYVALHTAGTVAVVDLHAGKVLHEIAVGRGPRDVALAGDKLFVTCEDDDALVVVSLDKLEVERRIGVRQAPHRLDVSPDGARVAVACRDEGVLWTRQGAEQPREILLATPGSSATPARRPCSTHSAWRALATRAGWLSRPGAACYSSPTSGRGHTCRPRRSPRAGSSSTPWA